MEAEELKQEISMERIPRDVARKILKIRDALINEDYVEAYHWCYAIAHPDFNVYSNKVWKELEKMADINN